MITTIFNREPALILGAINAIISLAVGFGLDWTGEQVSLVMVASTAILSIIVRQKVSPIDPPI